MPNGNIQFIPTKPIEPIISQPNVYVDNENQVAIIIPGDTLHENINARIIEAGLAPDKVLKLLMTAPVSVLNEQRQQEAYKRLAEEAKALPYIIRMVSGNEKYLSQKIGKVEGEKALKQVIEKSGKYSALATIVPGIGTATGFLVGSVVAITEIFIKNADKKTAKVMLTDFVTHLFPDALRYKETAFATITDIMSENDINKIIDLIKESFKGTKLQKAADSLYLSDKVWFHKDILNIANFRIPKKSNIKTLGLIGAGILALGFLIFKG